MAYQVLTDDGSSLDAHFDIDGDCIIFHSRGGTKGKDAVNVDYSSGLHLLLQRLLNAGIPVQRAWVDSSRVQGMSIDDRVILDSEDMALPPPEQISRMGSRMQAIGRDAASKSRHGNSTKRIRLQVATDILGSGLLPALKAMRRQSVRFVRDTSIALRNPRPLTLQEVVTELNDAAKLRPIGGLQKWRKTHLRLNRPGASTLFFSKLEPKRDWAFHAGGLLELQFNVGFEDADETRFFRHGVAFSLLPTRELLDVKPMRSKIARFNEYLRANPGAFEGLAMWHWDGGRTPNFPVSTIPDEAIHRGNFIFIGVLQPADRVSIDWILDDFDRLLPAYQYVESRDPRPPRARKKARKGFIWSPGNKARAAHTMYERHAATVAKTLCHNAVQDALFNHLESIHGEDCTSGEQDCGNRTLIDVAVLEGKDYTYYELKTAPTAQLCIREAIGQLLEYSYWPGAQQATRLVVVGEPPCDKEAAAYIKRLQENFSLPIEYLQFDMNSGHLVLGKQ